MSASDQGLSIGTISRSLQHGWSRKAGFNRLTEGETSSIDGLTADPNGARQRA